MTTWLCADLGGTKTLLGLAERGADGRVVIAHSQRYLAAEASSFEALLDDFLSRHQAAPAAACLGIAGPIEADADGHEHVRMTNLPWAVQATTIGMRLGGAPVRLVNDFHATAAGLDAVPPDQLVPLQPGEPRAHAPQVVIGAGTGLGLAYRIWNGAHYDIVPGESGHMNWAPSRAEFDRILLRLRAKLGRVGNEHVVSGIGLTHLHEAMLAEAGLPAMRLKGEEIAERADAGDPLAQRTIDLFLIAYGAIAGDHALTVLARGGVFVAGGIAQRWLARMQAGRFIEGFRDKGVYVHLAPTFPVHVVAEPALGLLGAAVIASRLAE